MGCSRSACPAAVASGYRAGVGAVGKQFGAQLPALLHRACHRDVLRDHLHWRRIATVGVGAVRVEDDARRVTRDVQLRAQH